MKNYRPEDVKNSIVSEFVGNNPTESPDTWREAMQGPSILLSLEELKESMEKFAAEIQAAVSVFKETPEETPEEIAKEKVTVSVRIDKEVKERFERVCHSVGFNISDAINIFARKVVSEQAIPFDVKLKPSKEEC